MRIMIGPTEISGIASGLKKGFDEIRAESEIVLSHPHPFSYGNSSKRLLPRTWLKLGAFHFHGRAQLHWSLRLITWGIWKTWSVFVWLWALARFDAFVFLFGKTITGSAIEARLYRLLRKRVVMIYCGSDARPPYVDGPTCNHFGAARVGKILQLSRRISTRIHLHERSGFICVNSPFTAQFHRKPFINWFKMGIPRECSISPPDASATPDKQRPSIKIVHSPSDPNVKGTWEIVEAVERIRREGHAIEMVMLTGVPNERVQRELADCDFIIDQLWSDTPMAAIVVEAAHFGKPAVTAGYAAAPRFEAAFGEDRPPSLFVTPDRIEEAIRRFVVDRALREEIGSRARAFVTTRWSPDVVARRYLDLLEGRVPRDSQMAPGETLYCYGLGLSATRARDSVAAVIAKAGVAGLSLAGDKPLERAFQELAAGPVPVPVSVAPPGIRFRVGGSQATPDSPQCER
jgi:glycosyltransferase involved in cell wall biosynthesis